MSRRSKQSVGRFAVAGSLFLALTGCRDKAAPSPPRRTPSASDAETTVSPSGDTAAIHKPAGGEEADAKDDPAAPQCLPKSGVVGQWAKHKPVVVLSPAELRKTATAAEAARFAGFRVRSAATCAYAVSRGGSLLVANVLVVEAESPEDAYGLMSCQSNSSETARIGGETRVERGNGLDYHCWQGRSYVRLRTDKADRVAAAESRRLLMYIAAQIHRQEAPALLEALPTDSALPGKRWLVRDLGCLADDVFGPGLKVDLETVSKLLGLSGDALMCIASYDVPQARRPNTVWLVHYPSAGLARQAYDRYLRHLAGTSDPVREAVNLMRPHGPFLIGTWTAQEESLQHMMPRIKQLLP